MRINQEPHLLRMSGYVVLLHALAFMEIMYPSFQQHQTLQDVNF